MSDCTCAEWGICHNCYDEKCDEVNKLEEENERLKSALRKLLSAIEHKFRHEEGIEEEIEAWYRDFGLEKEQGDE